MRDQNTTSLLIKLMLDSMIYLWAVQLPSSVRHWVCKQNRMQIAVGSSTSRKQGTGKIQGHICPGPYLDLTNYVRVRKKLGLLFSSKSPYMEEAPGMEKSILWPTLIMSSTFHWWLFSDRLPGTGCFFLGYLKCISLCSLRQHIY